MLLKALIELGSKRNENLQKYLSNNQESRPIFRLNQAIKTSFHRSKILILVADGSTRVLEMTTPCKYSQH